MEIVQCLAVTVSSGGDYLTCEIVFDVFLCVLRQLIHVKFTREKSTRNRGRSVKFVRVRPVLRVIYDKPISDLVQAG